MAKRGWTPEIRYIASIYPGSLEPIALNHGPSTDPREGRRTVYALEPVPREKARTNPFVIDVRDGFEDVLNLMGMQFGEKYMPKPVRAEETVACLLKHWTGNMVGIPAGAAPGIIEIANTIPTKNEHERMMETQTLYAEWLFQEGERLHREGNWKEITGAMKIMANWLGRDVVWANPERANKMEPCPACGELIMPKVSVCRHCHTRVRALPKDLAVLNYEEPVAATPA